jgi:hypothetical protein
MHNLFVSIPSVRGILPNTMWNVFDWRTALERAGHLLHGSSLTRMPLDLARNEMATVYLSTTCDLNMLLDDDVQVEPLDILKMMEAMDNGCDIVSAPCRMRSEGNLFNIIPVTEPELRGTTRVVECAWTGLGAVMVKRGVFEKLLADALQRDAGGSPPGRELETYRSTVMPEKTSVALFKSRIDPATRFFLESPQGENIYSLDDKAFSLRALEAGFKIHAAIDTHTCHDGMRGCFAEAVEALQAAQAAERSAARQPPRKALLGPDGRPL